MYTLQFQISLEKNSVASKWVDVVEMVASQDIDATDSEGEDTGEAFLAAMEKLKSEKPEDRIGNI